MNLFVQRSVWLCSILGLAGVTWWNSCAQTNKRAPEVFTFDRGTNIGTSSLSPYNYDPKTLTFTNGLWPTNLDALWPGNPSMVGGIVGDEIKYRTPVPMSIFEVPARSLPEGTEWSPAVWVMQGGRWHLRYLGRQTMPPGSQVTQAIQAAFYEEDLTTAEGLKVVDWQGGETVTNSPEGKVWAMLGATWTNRAGRTWVKTGTNGVTGWRGILPELGDSGGAAHGNPAGGSILGGRAGSEAAYWSQDHASEPWYSADGSMTLHSGTGQTALVVSNTPSTSRPRYNVGLDEAREQWMKRHPNQLPLPGYTDASNLLVPFRDQPSTNVIHFYRDAKGLLGITNMPAPWIDPVVGSLWRVDENYVLRQVTNANLTATLWPVPPTDLPLVVLGTNVVTNISGGYIILTNPPQEHPATTNYTTNFSVGLRNGTNQLELLSVPLR